TAQRPDRPRRPRRPPGTSGTGHTAAPRSGRPRGRPAGASPDPCRESPHQGSGSERRNASLRPPPPPIDDPVPSAPLIRRGAEGSAPMAHRPVLTYRPVEVSGPGPLGGATAGGAVRAEAPAERPPRSPSDQRPRRPGAPPRRRGPVRTGASA